MFMKRVSFYKRIVLELMIFLIRFLNGLICHDLFIKFLFIKLDMNAIRHDPFPSFNGMRDN